MRNLTPMHADVAYAAQTRKQGHKNGSDSAAIPQLPDDVNFASNGPTTHELCMQLLTDLHMSDYT